MRRALVLLAFLATPLAAQSHLSIYATGGKSVTTWHGQADMQALHVEWARPIARRWELAGVGAGYSFWQPRSWFGNQFGDGNESVQGASMSLLVRRNFARRLGVDPYVEASTGPMWTEKPVPASTSHFNFISEFGVGAVLMPTRRTPVLLGYRFQHISNGGYSPRNPGVNVSSLLVGVRMR